MNSPLNPPEQPTGPPETSGSGRLAAPVVLVNSTAGRGRAGHVGRELARQWKARGIRPEFCWPRTLDELRALAVQAGEAGGRRLIVVGGDGTLLGVVNALAGSATELGLIPAGDANDVAAALGLPREPLAAAELALAGEARAIDLVQAEMERSIRRFYLGVGGAGLDAEAARLAATRFRRLPGIWRYVAGALVARACVAPFELSADVDGIEWSGRAILAVAANAPAYGGGIRIAPEAQLDDGWLDAAILENLSWVEILATLPALLHSGDVARLPLLRYRARRIRMSCEPPTNFHGDGEFLGKTPVELKVLPGALRIVCPEPAGGGSVISPASSD